jgi:hypothetical protein
MGSRLTIPMLDFFIAQDRPAATTEQAPARAQPHYIHPLPRGRKNVARLSTCFLIVARAAPESPVAHDRHGERNPGLFPDRGLLPDGVAFGRRWVAVSIIEEQPRREFFPLSGRTPSHVLVGRTSALSLGGGSFLDRPFATSPRAAERDGARNSLLPLAAEEHHPEKEPGSRCQRDCGKRLPFYRTLQRVA